jgi:hypothetical protein
MYQLSRDRKESGATVGAVFDRLLSPHSYMLSRRNNLTRITWLVAILCILQVSRSMKSIIFQQKSNLFGTLDSCITPLLNWTTSENPRKRSQGTAALYTPYALLPGGGERYLLTFGKALIMQGYNIKLLMKNDNPTQTLAGVRDLCQQMQIDLPAFDLQIVEVGGGKIFDPPEIELFFALGNEKFPQVEGIGHINIYMCQFPFDLDRGPDAYEIKNLFSYDNIILNSIFTFSWYNKYLWKHIQNAHYSQLPAIDVLYPPVPVADQSLRCLSCKSTRLEVTIILLGRFFAGRQSKVCKLILYWYSFGS